MEVHNADLYHCIKCGSVERRVGAVADPPECCGQKMVKAAEQTISTEPSAKQPAQSK